MWGGGCFCTVALFKQLYRHNIPNCYLMTVIGLTPTQLLTFRDNQLEEVNVLGLCFASFVIGQLKLSLEENVRKESWTKKMSATC